MTNSVPSGRKAAERTGTLNRIGSPTGMPVSAFHNRAVWSKLPVSTCFPFGLYATHDTGPSCVMGEPFASPVAEFQMRAR